MQRALLPSAALALGLWVAAAEVSLVFAPALHQPVTKVLETRFEFVLDDLDMELNGRPIGASTLQSYMDRMDVKASSHLRLVDEYGAVEDGRPLSLVRRFESLLFEAESAAGLEISRHDAYLEGVALTFTWDPKREGYAVAADVKSLDLDKVSHRGEDMDLRSLLPGRAVQVGESWAVTGSEVLPVLWPGLDWDQARAALTETLERADLPVEIDGVFAEVVEAASIDCRAQGERETPSGALQVIELDAVFKLDLDLAESWDQVLRSLLGDTEEIEPEARMELRAELRGELLWDTAAGRAASLDMELDFTVVADLRASVGRGEDPLQGSLELKASGQLERGFTARAGR